MHMYFFAALACLVAYCDYQADPRRHRCGRPASSGAEFHHSGGDLPGGADFGRVVLHAGILVLEAGVLIWLPINWSGCS